MYKYNKGKTEKVFNTEFFHRRWNGGGVVHSHHNKLAGAFGITKKEWFKMIEDRNRKNKALRQKIKNGK